MSIGILELPGFVTEQECEDLLSWTKSNLSNSIFLPACGRVSTREYRGDISYPEAAFSVQSRLIKHLGFDTVIKAPFPHGIYSGYSDGKTCDAQYHAHRDPVYIPDTYTLHCNVVTTKTSGGSVTIDGYGTYEMNKGNILVFPVSELMHEVGSARDERNLWVFGFCIKKGRNK